MDKTPPLIAFLESQLGMLQGGLSVPESSFQVGRFADQPVAGSVTVCTLGISDHLFDDEDGRRIRQEFLFCCHPSESWQPEAIVAVVGQDVVKLHQALFRGEVIGPAGPLLPGSTCEALLCLSPVYWPDGLHVWRGSDPETVFVWLVPITHDEAHFVFEKGWKQLEALFVERQPDLLDLGRPSMLAEGNRE
jgi:hypothetical protein